MADKQTILDEYRELPSIEERIRWLDAVIRGSHPEYSDYALGFKAIRRGLSLSMGEVFQAVSYGKREEAGLSLVGNTYIWQVEKNLDEKVQSHITMITDLADAAILERTYDEGAWMVFRLGVAAASLKHLVGDGRFSEEMYDRMLCGWRELKLPEF